MAIQLRYLLIPLILLLSACAPQDEAPPPPIPREALIEILAESLILEPAGREVLTAKQDSTYEVHYERLLNRRGYSIDDFIASMQSLQSNPKELEAVYEEVLAQEQIIESEVGNYSPAYLR